MIKSSKILHDYSIHYLIVLIASALGLILFFNIGLSLIGYFYFYLIEIIPLCLIVFSFKKIVMSKSPWVLISLYIFLYPIIYFVFYEYKNINFERVIFESHLQFLASGGMHIPSLFLVCLAEILRPFLILKLNKSMTGSDF